MRHDPTRRPFISDCADPARQAAHYRRAAGGAAGRVRRTVYRDIRDLSLSGVPVEGEAGSGYRLLAGYDLPPLMLTTKESEALIAAIRLLKTWGGEALSQSLESAQEKMLAILPEARRRQAEQTRLFAPDLGAHRYAKTHFDVIHQAVSNQQGITASLPG